MTGLGATMGFAIAAALAMFVLCVGAAFLAVFMLVQAMDDLTEPMRDDEF